MIELTTPAAPWTIRFDRSVITDYNALDDSGTLRQETVDAFERIATDPLTGSPRKVRVDGDIHEVRVEQVSYALVVWEVNPDDEGRPATTASINQVYIHGIVQRGIDGEVEPAKAVRGGRDPADQTARFGVRFSEYDVEREISDLHATAGIQVEEEQWGDGEVLVGGELRDGRTDTLVDVAPASADVQLGTHVVRT